MIFIFVSVFLWAGYSSLLINTQQIHSKIQSKAFFRMTNNRINEFLKVSTFICFEGLTLECIIPMVNGEISFLISNLQIFFSHTLIYQLCYPYCLRFQMVNYRNIMWWFLMKSHLIQT